MSCATIATVTIEKTATVINLGDTLRLTGGFTTNDDGDPCQQGGSFEAYTPEGPAFSIGDPVDPFPFASYSIEYTPDAPGAWEFRFRITWGSDGMGLPDVQINRSEVYPVTVLPAPRVGTEAGSRGATAGAQGNSVDASAVKSEKAAQAGGRAAATSLDSPAATTGAGSITATAEARGRDSTIGVEGRAATASAGPTAKVGGVATRSVDASLPSRSADAGAERGI